MYGPNNHTGRLHRTEICHDIIRACIVPLTKVHVKCKFYMMHRLCEVGITTSIHGRYLQVPFKEHVKRSSESSHLQYKLNTDTS